ncbi:MAG: DUF3592 domain-containing protein [Deltaproteobacteria bacterium]|nr:DUF3592 domain-containing protein [Deltaproteobacteria bacterium]
MPIDQLIPALVGATLFGVPAFLLIRLWLRALASRRWPIAEGRITRSAVSLSAGKKEQASVQLTYEYEVGGKTYRSDTVRFGDFLNFSKSDAYATVARFSVGQRVEVRHHPRRPERATLEAKVSGFLIMWVVICLGVLASMGLGLAKAGTEDKTPQKTPEVVESPEDPG